MSFFRRVFSKKKIIETYHGNRNLKFDKSEYDATYNIAKAAFLLVGVRLFREDSPSAKLLWNVFYWFECANVLLAMTLELINMMQTAADGSFIDLFTMMPCVGYLILGIVKTYKIVYYRPVYENLIAELRDFWPQNTVTPEEYNIVRSALTKLSRLVKGYSLCNVTLCVMFVLPPFVVIVQRSMGQDIPLSLTFSYWLPFDQFQHGPFEVLAVLQTWQCSITLCFIFASDVLFCVFLCHITMQFELLGIRIKKMFFVSTDEQLIDAYPLGVYSADYIRDNTENNSINGRERIYQKNMVEIILKHRALIRLSGDVENQFTFSLLINFINSSVIICFCGFCCVFVEKWNEINYKLFLTTATLQIWLLCWYGQRLIESSEGISDAVYFSGWYNVPQNIKTSLIIILYRAQKVVCVTTYGFSVICMASYSTILKTSWSYLMLLVNVFKQD
ncbi:odorant receptor 85b-like [Battus philenor]|uniref:odorant receptor 85b-like n=1 Tax=Battus philenor TaxID=42288 RepID=UPI0035CF14B2